MNGLVLLSLLLNGFGSNHQVPYSDTTIVGKIIDADPIVLKDNFRYTGFKYYYGVHHLKVVKIDIANANKPIDTVILAYVYNMFTEKEQYKKGFNLKVGDTCIMYISSFTPCKSDFPKLQGRCSTNDLMFFPDSNRLVEKYNSIFRIIYAYRYKP